jgi:hypothetical protein
LVRVALVVDLYVTGVVAFERGVEKRGLEKIRDDDVVASVVLSSLGLPLGSASRSWVGLNRNPASRALLDFE